MTAPALTQALHSTDAALATGQEVLAKPQGAAEAAPATVEGVNRKTVRVRFSAPVYKADRTVLYPAGDTALIPRMPPGATAPPYGGHVLAPACPPEPSARLRLTPGALDALLAAQARAGALREELARLDALLAQGQATILGLYRQGAAPPPGYHVEIRTETTVGRRSPAWKEIASDLAVAAGEDRAAYQQRVLDATPRSPDKVTETLVVRRG